ncbi:MAG: gliding motility-associated ABC transporter ATP-binding subunit GldA [Bacteroidia bacterium]|nr:gliding motility-associated ABC transporter ATP-binding subunit GldA [Bacteroidia bacterium]
MAISVRNLTKIYDTQRAIDDISFEIATGQIVGFLGPNGAGKTTTMKIITSFMPPTEGTVVLDDHNIFDHPLEIRKQIGYLPEHNPLYLDMYVHEYLHFVGKLFNLSRNYLHNRTAEIIEMTGLGREQHKKIGMLSKGYRQRVGLAQALIHDPKVLILDEPTTGLDPNQIVEIRALIKEIAKEKTIIFSTHILPEVEAIADRVIIINRGKIVADEATVNLHAKAGGENLLRVEYENEGFDFKALTEMLGVLEISNEIGNQYLIRSEKEVDVRRKVFEESVRQDNPIRKLMIVETSLEDIFRDLTK